MVLPYVDMDLKKHPLKKTGKQDVDGIAIYIHGLKTNIY
jgi:hypothetical protein